MSIQLKFIKLLKKNKNCYTVTLVTLVRMTVPVTDKKCPTSLDLGIVSLVSSGQTGRPKDKYKRR